MHDLETTIVAVATPPGRGGIGCVRLSGPQALEVAARLFRGPLALDGKARFGRLLARDGSAVDRGYAVGFSPEAAYTGQATVELWAHGSPVVLAELVRGAVAGGARPAEGGEFTYRALRHGRLDLARAEAVRDLIGARTLLQARVAHAQAEGALSRALEPLKDLLEDLLARGEAAVEFADESETELPEGALPHGIREARARCAGLLAGFEQGRRVREGATVVLTGRPNVGKSSLFNALLARDRAIVSDQPGTTRDTLEEALDLDGLLLRLVDTAGLRPAADALEDEGVRRAHRAAGEADLRLWVVDRSRPLRGDEPEALERARNEAHVLVIWTKSDLPDAGVPAPGEPVVSARTGEGLASLRAVLRSRLVEGAGIEHAVLTDTRHAQALQEAAEVLESAQVAYAAGTSLEYVLEDLRRALHAVGTITGGVDQERLYDRIFATFCIGK
jgi:tRNA modification GTPase